MRIAIVGSGVSGLVCAHLLHRQHEITVFEASEHVGGHVNTVEVEEHGRKIAVDTGFIVFNKRTYPRFVKLIEDLGVGYQETSMSFSVSCDRTGIEYNGTNLNGLFAQRLNLFRPSFLRMVKGILGFNRAAKAFLADHAAEKPTSTSTPMTLRDFARSCRLDGLTESHYLIPMAAAVWSADPGKIWDFPAHFVLRFWDNHGFLEVNDRPQWYVIKGGSKSYVDRLISPFLGRIRTGTPVTAAKRLGNAIELLHGQGQERFDALIIATHSDQAIRILQDASTEERNALTAIPYQENTAVLHTDDSVLPSRRPAVAAWNYHLPQTSAGLPTVTYQMNILQGLRSQLSYNVSLNPVQRIDHSKVLRRLSYSHPVFLPAGLIGQRQIKALNGRNNTFFCGAYLGNGFHEDGVASAYEACRLLGATADG